MKCLGGCRLADEEQALLGVVLLLKLAANSAAPFCALLQTACFVAAYTGSLDRVIREARLPKSDVTRYRRLAVIHTAVCWICCHAVLCFQCVFMFYVDLLLVRLCFMSEVVLVIDLS